MAYDGEVRKVAFVADYVPRQCGIATFTENLHHAVAERHPGTECIVVPVSDVPSGYDYPLEARFEFEQDNLDSYRQAADFLNFGNVDIVSLQHEYGIFGGPAGSHILALLRNLSAPVVTTLHTILEQPNADQRRVLKQLAELSARMVVMTERGGRILQDVYQVPAGIIELIPHGIPDMPFVDSNFFKDQFDVDGKLVALTFGLLSPNKGIEYVLRALPQVIQEFPHLVYLVLGATHPNLVREQGEEYRLSLMRLVHDLGIGDHVIFYNRFVELNELIEFIGAADLYITPYLNRAQVTSGTLAYAFGSGKAVISTPYWHAEELLADGRGVLVPFADAEGLASAMLAILRDEPHRHAMRKKAYLLGREMIWPRVAELYMEAFRQARKTRGRLARNLHMRTVGLQKQELPQFRLGHLLRLTDSTGIIQHARYTIPAFSEGYCTDDNARALLLTVLLEQLGHDTVEIMRAQTTYAAFLDFAFDASSGRFRNFLSFDRAWLDTNGSDDCLGRAIWALGTCIVQSERRDLQRWAVPVFEQAVGAAVEASSPRAWATSLLGINAYLAQFSGDRQVSQVRNVLVERLLDSYQRTACESWGWFEDVVAYDNARIPQALLASGRGGDDGAAIEVGLTSLTWLAETQTAKQGWFRPVGSNGFWCRHAARAEFDQQPLEAGAMVSAAIEAYHTTNDTKWLSIAQAAFDWFLGRNAIGKPVYDAKSGGCCDGLHEDRVNFNQGAESTVSFLLALAEMRLLEASLAAFGELKVRSAALPPNG